MTVSISERLSPLYEGNGLNTRFDFTFRVFDQEDASGISVKYRDGVDFISLDESLYLITVNEDNMGGFVTFHTPPLVSFEFYISGETPVDQLLDITNYDNFYPEALEKALDKLTSILQEWFNLLGFETTSRKLNDQKYDELAIARENELRSYLEAIINNLFVGEPLLPLGAQYIVDGALNQKQINAFQLLVNDSKADKYGFRWSPGGTGSTTAINTILGYSGNGIAPGIRGAHVQQGSQFNENIIGGDPATIGLAQPNLIDYTQTFNAHYALIFGYDNVCNALAGMNAGYHCYIAADATHGAIWGGSYHKILDGDYSAIIGGTKNVIDFTGLNGNFGAYSAIFAGNENVIRARMSTILSGIKNRIGQLGANNEFSGISNSNLSTIDGNYASVISGNECKATRDYSHASGKYAVSNSVGERAFSTGRFLTTGDSGQSILHLLRQTTNATTAQLLCSDVDSPVITPMGIYTSLLVRAFITGYNVTDNTTCAFEITAQLSRGDMFTNVVLNAHTVNPIFNPNSFTVAIVPSTTLYQVRVTGAVGKTVNWTCRLETVWARNI
ncbi:hypothetical protein [Acinetobacter dispersus]|uniref:hypothetical protein n=1 Tax=Acinetobacter dispersus TaxID=70348 RepID=UPI001F4B0A3B|nr:hypothetical protein [Acinetobacter dispersus]MCH7392416.1 hypothetical protein [Acinetobacter dispersus]